LLFAEFDKERPVPRLSIVIPCLGGAAEFDGTLVSVLQNRPADCEVLVVHTAAYDDPYQLGEEVQFLRASSRSLVELINSACQHATGEIVHLVGCGLEDCLDRCDFFAGTDEVARGASAKQQPDGFDEDGLAGPGFATEDVQAGLELDLYRVDDCQPPDAKEPEHRKEGNSNPNIGLTAFSHHATVLHTSY
jgi:hypothetical protein